MDDEKPNPEVQKVLDKFVCKATKYGSWKEALKDLDSAEDRFYMNCIKELATLALTRGIEIGEKKMLVKRGKDFEEGCNFANSGLERRLKEQKERISQLEKELKEANDELNCSESELMLKSEVRNLKEQLKTEREQGKLELVELLKKTLESWKQYPYETRPELKDGINPDRYWAFCTVWEWLKSQLSKEEAKRV